MLLFFDTETTGLPADGLPPDHPDQPELMQLAAILSEDDGTERATLCLYIHGAREPHPQALAVHGIDRALTARAGVTPGTALSLLIDLARRADLVIAHNLRFDLAVLEVAGHRWAPGWSGLPATCATACTMRRAAPVLALPPTERMIAAGRRGPKPPSLQQAHTALCGGPFAGAHDALADVRACLAVWLALDRLGVPR